MRAYDIVFSLSFVGLMFWAVLNLLLAPSLMWGLKFVLAFLGEFLTLALVPEVEEWAKRLHFTGRL